MNPFDEVVKAAREDVAKLSLEPAEANRRRRQRLAYHWVRRRVPVQWTRAKSDAQLLELVAREYRAALKAWRPTESNLLMTGNTGTGKTTAAILALRSYANDHGAEALSGAGASEVFSRCHEFGERLAFVSVPQMAQEAREHRFGADCEPALVELAKAAELLVLDDLGNETDSKMLSIFDIADWRSRNSLRTIVTSGFTLAQLDARYGEATMRRLSERNGEGAMCVELA